ncbi:MAG: RIP metalloprotease RseP [Candidatus Cloacimonetes bacterium]|nr:RIP metalloprotease RseP [Candidatus Cloacimonadota bacterium]
MEFIIGIIGAILVFGVLVLVHEAGHFIAARFFGVEVEKFSIGFGPKLFSFTSQKTEFRVSAIPLGGYLKMKGENPDEQKSDTDSFHAKKWWQRAIIAFSGPFANFIFAILIFIFSFALGKSYEDNLPIIGKSENAIFQSNDLLLNVNGNNVESWTQIIKFTNENEIDNFQIERNGEIIFIETDEISKENWLSDFLPAVTAKIGEVTPGLPAYKAGLMQNDEILAVNEITVSDWYEMRNAIGKSTTEKVILTIKRDAEIFKKTVNLDTNLIDNRKIIGIIQPFSTIIHEKYNLLEATKFGILTSVNVVATNYAMLFKLIANPQTLKSNVGGPVMIYTMSQQYAKKGVSDTLMFIATISIILMVMNLLPIPILDGGLIFFCFVEGIRGKILPKNIQFMLQKIGMLLLLFLMIFAFWNDLSRIYFRNSSIKQHETRR